MQKITPFLWFDNNAEEAIEFYLSTFKNSKLVGVNRHPPSEPSGLNPTGKGALLSAVFALEGQEFMVLNGGPMYEFSPAISLFVDCETQEEVDELWEKLTVGGTTQKCGWLTDKFGVSWQIIPKALGQLLSDPDSAKSQRVMQAMLQMTKIDIAGLTLAHRAP